MPRPPRSMAPTAPHVSAVAIVGCRDCRAGIKIGGLGQQDPKTIAMRETHQPERPRRRSIRLPDYDYSQVGAYFVTICTWKWICLFGDIINTEMCLNGLGRVAQERWEDIPKHFSAVEIDAFVVMPNHLHGIIVITGDPLEATQGPPLQYPPSGPPKGSVGAIVGSYKSAVSKRINAIRGAKGKPVWQRNYYEQIVLDEDHLNRVRQYIFDNPACWENDPENPARPVSKGGKTRSTDQRPPPAKSRIHGR